MLLYLIPRISITKNNGIIFSVKASKKNSLTACEINKSHLNVIIGYCIQLLSKNFFIYFQRKNI